MKVAKPKLDDLLLPDAWERFERAVDVVAKSPPQHRMKPKPDRRVAESRKSDSTDSHKKGGRRPSKRG
jgi:hypothetical protein